MGFGLTHELVMHTAYLIAEKSQRKHSFSKEAADRSWFEGFVQRHQMLTIRSPQPLSYARAVCANPSDFFGCVWETQSPLQAFTDTM